MESNHTRKPRFFALNILLISKDIRMIHQTPFSFLFSGGMITNRRMHKGFERKDIFNMARMRRKKNIPLRMDACSAYWFLVPVANRGHWREACSMPKETPLFLELGCGKGGFAIETARRNPDICYVALEKEESVILAAIEKAAAAGVTNLFFVWTDVILLKNFFDDGEVDRIYINFCDPWSRREKPKRRLTHRDYLQLYRHLLKEDGEIHFKTDDSKLFAFSLEEFVFSGFHLDKHTNDLHASEWNSGNVRTEFEQKFADRGVSICRVEARKSAMISK